MKSAIATVFVCLLAADIASAQPADVAAHAKRSDMVVVAVVENVVPRFAVNEHGDRLIVSEVWLRVEETLKGTAQNLVPMEVEGGTLGDLTLRVSDLPVLKSGDRGLFLLETSTQGKNKPQGRGNGILKLDRADRVAGTNLRLADVKASIKASQN